MDEGVRLAGYVEHAGQTTVHPLGLLAVAVLGLCVLLLPRRWAVVPMLAMACFVSSAQRIVIVGCDFNFLRIMVLFGVMRLVLRKEYLNFQWRPVDTAMALWAASSMLFFVIRVGSFQAVINRLGFGFDAFGMYFLFRCLIRNWSDIDHIIIGIILISIPVAFFFLLENRTGRNLFSIFGGVAEITWVREGRLRCQGAYSHPILAGIFWAVLLPLIAAFGWKSPKNRILAVIGLITSLTVVVCSASATPLMGVLAAVVGGLAFFLRRYMRPLRWGLLLTVIGLHIMMNAPVWHLIGRVSAVGGSTGHHRYLIIDLSLKNFQHWWFSGASAYEIYSWGIPGADVTNQYFAQGVTSGFLTMCLFIATIAYAFRAVGQLWRRHSENPFRLALSWALGVSLFVHCVNFIGVTYFGQIDMLWYLTLALIASASTFKVQAATQSFKKRSSKKHVKSSLFLSAAIQ